jgi:hypothetical protein
MRTRRIAALSSTVACAALAIVLAPREASAFSPRPCAKTSYFQNQKYRWKVGVDATSDAPLSPVAGGLPYARYRNQTKVSQYLLTNQYVSGISFHFSSFDLETNYDYLRWGDNAGYFAWADTGALGSSVGKYLPNYVGSFQHNPVEFTFSSDYSVEHEGFSLDSVDVVCNGASDSGVFIAPYYTRIDGVLLGYDDVVYFALPGDTNPAKHISVAMWAPDDDAGDTDFDIFLECGAWPTSSSTLHSASTRMQEFVEFDVASHPCPGSWIAAVHSYPKFGGTHGSGFFHVLAAKHIAAQHFTYTAGLRNAGPFDVASARAMLQHTSRGIYHATSGQVLVDWNLTNLPSTVSPSCDDTWKCGGARCNVCLALDGSGGYTFGPDKIVVGYDAWAGTEYTLQDRAYRLVHEFGHARLGLTDFYYDPAGVCGPGTPVAGSYDTTFPSWYPTSDRAAWLGNACGHSMMANSFLNKTYCTTYDHFRNPIFVNKGNEHQVVTTSGVFDGVSGASSVEAEWAPSVLYCPTDTYFPTSYTPTTHASVWPDASDYAIGVANGVLLYEPSGSVDPYDFDSFDSAGFPGTVTGP